MYNDSHYEPKKIPQSLSECTKVDRTASELFTWSERIEHWANVVAWITVICGLISGIVLLSINSSYLWSTALLTIVICIVSALISYFILNCIATLIRGFASITHNTNVTANIALLKAHTDPNLPNEKPNTISKSTSSSTPSIPSSTPTPPSSSNQPTKRVCRCGKCGALRNNAEDLCPNCGSTMKVYKDEPAE